MATPEHIAAEAEAFILWREGFPVSWDCTAEELADATDTDVDRVRLICAERGWPIHEGTEHDQALTATHG